MISTPKIIKQLKSYANPKNLEGMRRFGMRGKGMLGGPSIPILRKMAKDIKKQSQDRHFLAQKL